MVKSLRYPVLPIVESSLGFREVVSTITEADLAASLRQTYHWKLPDAFQAAFAKHHRLKLVTRNTKDFNPSIHYFVVVPYVL